MGRIINEDDGNIHRDWLVERVCFDLVEHDTWLFSNTAEEKTLRKVIPAFYAMRAALIDILI